MAQHFFTLSQKCYDLVHTAHLKSLEDSSKMLRNALSSIKKVTDIVYLSPHWEWWITYLLARANVVEATNGLTIEANRSAKRESRKGWDEIEGCNWGKDDKWRKEQSETPSHFPPLHLRWSPNFRRPAVFPLMEDAKKWDATWKSAVGSGVT